MSISPCIFILWVLIEFRVGSDLYIYFYFSFMKYVVYINPFGLYELTIVMSLIYYYCYAAFLISFGEY